MTPEELLIDAQLGDIRAFHTLFSEFHPQLKSYLYTFFKIRTICCSIFNILEIQVKQ